MCVSRGWTVSVLHVHVHIPGLHLEMSRRGELCNNNQKGRGEVPWLCFVSEIDSGAFSVTVLFVT